MDGNYKTRSMDRNERKKESSIESEGRAVTDCHPNFYYS